MNEISIIGAGLAGSEAAWQVAEKGIGVKLYEMRPLVFTGAHISDRFAELVCSNSLGSNLPNKASGLLKEELRIMGSLLLDCAERAAIPAGAALAVDREAFSSLVTERLSHHLNIEIIRKEMTEIPHGVAIIASGPLTSPSLVHAIQALTGQRHMFFYDAIAPIVWSDTIDMNIAFKASRYQVGELDEGDYINCPFTEEQYKTFVTALKSAERIQLRDFETEIKTGVSAGTSSFFEGCLPVEVMAERGDNTLAFGPMRPTGLRDPHTGKRPFAVIQLRQDNLAGSLYNLVGFQTNLTYLEQKRVFQMIPGLENADFMRYGQMHRNTYIASPNLLNADLQFRTRPGLFFAGQITGVEGYMGNIATGLLAGMNAARYVSEKTCLVLPPTTMIGALCQYISHAEIKDFQPMKANYGILSPLEHAPRSRKDRSRFYGERALKDLELAQAQFERLNHIE